MCFFLVDVFDFNFKIECMNFTSENAITSSLKYEFTGIINYSTHQEQLDLRVLWPTQFRELLVQSLWKPNLSVKIWTKYTRNFI